MTVIDHDIAVIGAGPAGSSAAAALAARGWRVLLIERDRLPRHKVCGEFLSPEAQGTLSELGLFDTLAALQPVSLPVAQLISRQGSRLNTAMPAPGWGLSRYAMDDALACAAKSKGACVWQGATLVDRSDEGLAQRLTVRRHGRTIQLHVAATILAGGRSLAPKLLTQPAPNHADRLNVGVKAHYAGIDMPQRVEVYLFDGGYVGINPVENGAANVCLLASYAAFAAAGRRPAQLFDWIAQQNPAFGARLAGARLQTGTLCSVAGVDTGRPSRPWNGVACLGDTATMIPPLCGDGMAMALHSAALCVPYADAYLHGRIDLATWASSYAADWHAAFDGRLRVGRTLQAMLSSRFADSLLRAGNRLPSAASYFARATRGPTSVQTPELIL